jgi:uncharacterized protein with ATP-grasp and redox domains
MKTYLDCFPCFYNQALKTARMITTDEKLIREILIEVGLMLPDMPEEATPPEIGKEVYGIVSRLTGVQDPFFEIKKMCTQQALFYYPRLKDEIRLSENSLYMAARIAIAGNIIDFGANTEFDIKKDLDNILFQDLAMDHFQAFESCLKKAKNVLYIGDNAGEAVFDRLLIEEMKKPTVFVVREKPIINDVLFKDAQESGIEGSAKIISSGSDAPGNILRFCSDEFIDVYRSADLIVSKGQGNYEALSEEDRPIFFLLKAKCPVIAQDIGVPQGSSILKKVKTKK